MGVPGTLALMSVLRQARNRRRLWRVRGSAEAPRRRRGVATLRIQRWRCRFEFIRTDAGEKERTQHECRPVSLGTTDLRHGRWHSGPGRESTRRQPVARAAAFARKAGFYEGTSPISSVSIGQPVRPRSSRQARSQPLLCCCLLRRERQGGGPAAVRSGIRLRVLCEHLCSAERSAAQRCFPRRTQSHPPRSLSPAMARSFPCY